MTLANIPVGLDRAESAGPQLPADLANGLGASPHFWEAAPAGYPRTGRGP
jgi:hypothetical protein